MSRKVIPDYAKDYKNEYLFIRGIDKQFKYFLDNIEKADQGVFQNNRVEIIEKNINRLEKAIKMGYFKDNSNLEIDGRDFLIQLYFWSGQVILVIVMLILLIMNLIEQGLICLQIGIFQVIKILLNVLSYFIVNLNWYLIGISIKLFGLIVIVMSIIYSDSDSNSDSDSDSD